MSKDLDLSTLLIACLTSVRCFWLGLTLSHVLCVAFLVQMQWQSDWWMFADCLCAVFTGAGLSGEEYSVSSLHPCEPESVFDRWSPAKETAAAAHLHLTPLFPPHCQHGAVTETTGWTVSPQVSMLCLLLHIFTQPKECGFMKGLLQSTVLSAYQLYLSTQLRALISPY